MKKIESAKIKLKITNVELSSAILVRIYPIITRQNIIRIFDQIA